MNDVKMHTRSEYANKLGRRVSKGEWERRNRAYEVHLQDSWIHEGYVIGEGGEKLKKVRRAETLVLMRETTKCNRKVSMGNRYGKHGTRARYLDEPAGHVR